MIQKYITELLHEYNCVVLPNLGGFITRYISADIHPITNKITPPSKEIAFNEMLNTDDGMLVAYLSAQQHITLEQALEMVAKFVQQTKEDLKRFNVILIDGIGKLFYNEANRLDFLPELESNFLEDSFGLGELFLKPIESNYNAMDKIPPKSTRPPLRRRPIVKKEETKIKQLKRTRDSENESETAERIFKPAMLWGLITLFLVGASTLVYMNKNSTGLASMFPFLGKNSISLSKSTADVLEDTASATAETDTDAVLESTTVLVSKKYFVVVGSFQNVANAQKLVDKFAAKNKALTLVSPLDGEQSYRVAAAKFDTKTEARAQLKNYKSQFGTDAWVLTR